MKILTAIIVLFALTNFSFSQELDKVKLDKFFASLAENNKAMGSLSIRKDGDVLYNRAIGFSKIDGAKKVSSTPQTKYRIGSITKMFTATMVFQLIEKGKLKQTDTLDKYFPNIPNAKKIMITNLLNHRSGIHNFTDDTDYLKWMISAKTQAEILSIIAKNKSDFEPDTKSSYSNSNYVLLGYIIEKASGKSYQKFLEENIISKIGLKNTYLGDSKKPGENESFSYIYTENWKASPETDLSIPGGAGAIISTSEDLTKFADALFNFKIVSENSLNKMKTINGDYGLGIIEYPLYGKKVFGHTGGIDGFNSVLIYSPEDKLSIAYISNGMVYSINDIILGVSAIYLNKPFTVPTFETVKLKSEELDKYLGVYANTDLPLEITITKKDNALFAQATGQPAFPLEAMETDKFKFDPARVVIEFDTSKNQLTLKQGGQAFAFKKK
ncbi:MAG: serine hydrolase [Acidobacteriota bacterium]|jgi:CubicO group peptidase (beta-lactamase class C family)|nr:serine hydrolase [Acidobacteriota bacterium]